MNNHTHHSSNPNSSAGPNTHPSGAWTDFNNAEAQQGAFEMIPRGTALPIRMTIKPGGFDSPAQGWTGGWATESRETGAIYLACEFIVTAGPYAKRKIWTNVGLYSPKGPTWAQMGRSFIRAALNSAWHVDPQDTRPEAVAARCIQSLGDLDGLEFLVRADAEKDEQGNWRNVVKVAIEPDHKDYAQWMTLSDGSGTPTSATSQGHPAGPFRAPASTSSPPTSAAMVPGRNPSGAAPHPVNKPAWAQ